MENTYQVTLAELERSAHVPLAEQVEEVPEQPNGDAISAEERERLALLRVAG